MGIFSFIENFFFISLVLVFFLVVLLVYHFKNRIVVAEKKSESMYGLLTAVVKEIKILRGMFGLGVEAPVVCLKPKSEPEVIEREPVISQPVLSEPKEVITFELAPLREENKIVVSDMDDSDDSDEEDDNETSSYDSSSDSDESDDAEVMSLDGVDEVPDNEVPDNEVYDMTPEVVQDMTPEVVPEVVVPEAGVFNEFTEPPSYMVENDTSSVDLVGNVHSIEIIESARTLISDRDEDAEVVAVVDESNIKFTSPSVEQLRKMNINQLKTIAAQHGISSDMSRLKKNDLITLIQNAI